MTWANDAHKRRKPNATGRREKHRFARLDHRLLESAAYRALSPNARSLLVELTSMHNGSNNGEIWLSVRDAAARTGVANLRSTQAAFGQLQALGFIAMTQDAYFVIKAADTSRARCWRLTWEAQKNVCGPTNEYLEREPEPGTLDRKRMERGLIVLKQWKRKRSLTKESR